MKTFYGTKLPNPLMLGTAQYPSPAILESAFRESRAGVATVSLRRESGAGQTFWQMAETLWMQRWQLLLRSPFPGQMPATLVAAVS